MTLLSSEIVRGIALTPTHGLARSSRCWNWAPLKVPVGEKAPGPKVQRLRRGDDEQEEVLGGEWRSIHQPSVPLTRRTVVSEIFETGIKAIDVLAPWSGAARGACSAAPAFGKNRMITELIHNTVGRHQASASFAASAKGAGRGRISTGPWPKPESGQAPSWSSAR